MEVLKKGAEHDQEQIKKIFICSQLFSPRLVRLSPILPPLDICNALQPAVLDENANRVPRPLAEVIPLFAIDARADTIWVPEATNDPLSRHAGQLCLKPVWNCISLSYVDHDILEKYGPRNHFAAV